MNLASLAERNLAEYGDYVRLVFEGKHYTNRELHDQSARLAGAFAELGLESGDKVVVMMPNCPEVLVSYPAIWRAGLTAIPVLFLLEQHELAYILDNSGARAIVTSPDAFPKVAAATQHCQRPIHVIVTGEPGSVPDGCLSFGELAAHGTFMSEIVERDDNEIATILYTSGTTASPKGVLQTHHNLHASALNSLNTAGDRHRGETSLIVLPLAHSFGLSVLLVGYLFGGRGILMRWFDPEGALELIERYKVTAMAGVPTMFVYMMVHARAHRYDTSSVTRWLVGAAPMAAEQIRAFEKKFGGTMYVGYGLTESCPGVATEREGMPRKTGSTGVPLEGVRVKIVDDEGSEVARGTVGEVCAKGDNISPGYFQNPEATAETFRDGWLHTGDVGYLDEDNYLFIVGRKKDLVIRGGLNVYPKDVEEVIYRVPAVQEAAVVGVPDPLMGEEVCAYVVKRSGVELTAEELIAHCQANLAKYKSPKYVEFVDSLPKTSIGKISKKEVRRLAAAKYGRISVFVEGSASSPRAPQPSESGDTPSRPRRTNP
jgi:long-chain acyl-CoA synthetase